MINQTLKMYIFLIILDLILSLSAWIYDWPTLITIPIYLWPVVAICPIYPLLLAFVWYQKQRNQKPHPAITAWVLIGASTYASTAVFFYPALMRYEGFSWLGIGAIAWVLLYGSQALYLLRRVQLPTAWITITIAVLSVKTLMDVHYHTFGYLITPADNLPRGFINAIASVVIAAGLLVSLYALRKS